MATNYTNVNNPSYEPDIPKKANYNILGVNKSVTMKNLRSRYKNLLKEVRHDPIKFRDVNEAYRKVLYGVEHPINNGANNVFDNSDSETEPNITRPIKSSYFKKFKIGDNVVCKRGNNTIFTINDIIKNGKREWGDMLFGVKENGEKVGHMNENECELYVPKVSIQKPTGPKPTGSKPTGPKPTGPKPTGSKPTGPKPWEAASVFGNMSPNYATATTLEGRPEVDPINKNLATRSSIYKGNNVKPNPYIMFNPDSSNPFYANMWLNDAHKDAARLSGVKPENIVDRYKYQRRIGSQYAAAAVYNARQAELQRAAANAAKKKANEEEALLKGAKYLEAKANYELLDKAAKQARMIKQTAKANAGLKKPFWKFWGGSGKNRTRRHRR